jgi:O-antigen/teichoic acid export membrane protein
MSRSYLKSIKTSYLLQIIGLFVGLYLTPFILDYISKAEYGAYALVQSFIVFFGLFNFGFGGALSLFVSQNNEKSEKISTYVGVTATLQLIVGLLGGIVGLVGSFYFYEWFDFSSVERGEVQTVILFFLCGFIFLMAKQTYSSILNGFRKIHIENYIGMAGLLFNTVLIIFLLSMDAGLAGLAAGIALTELLKLLISIYCVHKYIPAINIKYFNFDKKAFVDLYNVGVWFFVGSISVMLIERVDKIIVAKLVSIEMVATLIITVKLFDISRKFIYLISNNYRPYLAKLISNGKNVEAYKAFCMLRLGTILLSILSASIVIYINEFFVFFWVGEEFYAGNHISWILGFNLIYLSWKMPARVYLTSNTIVKQQSIIGIVEGLFSVFLSYIFGIKYGLTGILIGVFLAGFVVHIIGYGYILHKYGLETWPDYLKKNFTIAIQMGVIMIMTFIMSKNFPLDFIFSTSVILKISSFIVLISLFAVFINIKTINKILTESVW